MPEIKLGEVYNNLTYIYEKKLKSAGWMRSEGLKSEEKQCCDGANFNPWSICFAPCKYCSISKIKINLPRGSFKFRFYLLFYVTFRSQGHIAMGRLQVEETSAYSNVNHPA